ncbi:MAG: hypothetical protein ACRDX9_08270 [Acidimicrobiia bacterium]
MTDETSAADTVLSGLAENLTRVFGEASPETLFTSPTQLGDDLVISAAAWERVGGFGFGTGEGQGEAGDVGSGQGGGGGGMSQGRPVAVIRVGPGGVEVTPVIDFTKIGVTLLLGAVGVWRALHR